MIKKDQIVRVRGHFSQYRVVLVQHYWALLEPCETTLAAVLAEEDRPRFWRHTMELI